MIPMSSGLILEGRGTRDDLDELGGNARLAGLVVLEGERLNELAGVLRGVLHGRGARRLLRGGAVEHRVVELRGDHELAEVREDLRLGVRLELVGHHRLSITLAIEGDEALHRGLVRHRRHEMIVDDVHLVKLRRQLCHFRRKASDARESGRVLSIGGGRDDVITAHATKLRAALLAPDHDLHRLAVRCQLRVDLLHVTSNERVDAAAEALVRRHGHDEVLLRPLRHVKILAQHRRTAEGLGKLVERFDRLEAFHVRLHLGGGDHLHRRGDLFEVVGRDDAHGNLLLGGEATGRHARHGRRGGRPHGHSPNSSGSHPALRCAAGAATGWSRPGRQGRRRALLTAGGRGARVALITKQPADFALLCATSIALWLCRGAEHHRSLPPLL
mmetsp:Transcript_7067/g.17820  ORF Transcript_7067/g.17820 Transcript_7067/m.17820 type:complete len:387 (-) Transcript_7067:21-1181(-)